jgi:cobalt/nickel transport protein
VKCSVGLPVALIALSMIAAASQAHYNMLLPGSWSAKKGDSVTITYQWGHPFEHQLFDAPLPEAVLIVPPGGAATLDLNKTRQEIKVAGEGQNKLKAHRFQFTPQERGDYVIVLHVPPIWMEEEQEFLHDKVKVVLHVQAQKGWDHESYTSDYPLDLAPLTRPYGLQPGMAFQVQVRALGKPVPNTLVEIEHYNPAPPEKLPPDEHITRTAKSDPSGVVTTTLTDPGWWCITAQQDGGKRMRDGKEYPVRRRVTFWVYVDERSGSKSSK